MPATGRLRAARVRMAASGGAWRAFRGGLFHAQALHGAHFNIIIIWARFTLVARLAAAAAAADHNCEFEFPRTASASSALCESLHSQPEQS